MLVILKEKLTAASYVNGPLGKTTNFDEPKVAVKFFQGWKNVGLVISHASELFKYEIQMFVIIVQTV